MNRNRTAAKIIIQDAIQAWCAALDGKLAVNVQLPDVYWPDECRIVPVRPNLAIWGSASDSEVEACLAGCYFIARYDSLISDPDKLTVEAMFLDRLSRGRGNVYRYDCPWCYQDDMDDLTNAINARVRELFRAILPACAVFNDYYDNLRSSEPAKVLMFLSAIVHSIETLEAKEAREAVSHA